MKLSEAIAPIKPKALKNGGVIGITAPSSQISVKNIYNFKKAVENAGFKVVLGETIVNMYDRDFNSASDEMRAKDFNNMVRNTDIDIVWSGGGGFGAQTTTRYIDFDAIVENPKPIIGFSDNTFFLNAITQKTNVITFLGPTAEISDPQFDKKNINYALDMLTGNLEYPFLVDNFSGIVRRVSSDLDRVVGRFIGGNLTMLQTSIGTEWEIETDGKILLLEETGESSYSVERTLDHLESAGKFENPAAIILGEFESVQKEPITTSRDANPSINEIISKMFRNRKYPVIMDYNFSHGKYNLTFPLGAMGIVDNKKRVVEVIENPVK